MKTKKARGATKSQMNPTKPAAWEVRLTEPLSTHPLHPLYGACIHDHPGAMNYPAEMRKSVAALIEEFNLYGHEMTFVEAVRAAAVIRFLWVEDNYPQSVGLGFAADFAPVPATLDKLKGLLESPEAENRLELAR